MPKPIDKEYSFGQLNNPHGAEDFPTYDSSRTIPLARLRRYVFGRNKKKVDFTDRDKFRAQVLRVDMLENDDKTNIGFFDQRSLINANLGEKVKNGATFGIYARVYLFHSTPFPITLDALNNEVFGDSESQKLIEQHVFFTALNAHAQPPAPGDIVWVNWLAKSGPIDQWREPVYLGKLDEATGAGTVLGGAFNSAARAFREISGGGDRTGLTNASDYKGGEGAIVEPIQIDNSEFSIHGIDTSGHQRNKNLKHKILAKEQKFHIIKVTERNTYFSKESTSRLAASRASGALTGPYHFLRSDKASGTAEAAHFLKHYKKVSGDLPPMADLEKGLKGGAAEHNINVLHAVEWAKAVKEGLGITGKLLLYTTRPSWGNYMYKADRELLKDLAKVYDLVWADYVRAGGKITNDLDKVKTFKFTDLYRSIKSGLPWQKPVIWQWTGYGKVEGHFNKYGRLKRTDRCLMRDDYFKRVSLTR